jgi:putative heme-binding domain-containing protein
VRFSLTPLRSTLLPLLIGAAPFAAVPGKADTGEAERTNLAIEALSRLQSVNLDQNPKLKETVLTVLEKTRGTADFVRLVRQFSLTGQEYGLLDAAIQNSANDAGAEAARLLLAAKNRACLANVLQGTNSSAAVKVAQALGNSGEKGAVEFLLPLVAHAKGDPALRKQAVRSLAQTPDGAAALLGLARDEKLADELKFIASSELNGVRWPQLKAEAAKILPLPPGRDAEPLPPVTELLKRKGDAASGANVFARASVGCANCHQVNGQGIDLGPNLSEIGSKLGKDALYEAILDPSAGISFGYEAWQLTLKSGDEAYGVLVSDTADEVAVKAVGGIVTRYRKSDIASREQMKLSIMPAGLQQAMTTQELVDLVEYLSSLTKTRASP